MTQIYSTPAAIQRMRNYLCPECAYQPHHHSGWGGSNGCSLTDNGVYQRISKQIEIDTESDRDE